MMENIPIKTIDRDEGRKSYIEYSLLAQTAEEDDGPFILGPVNGLLRVSASLDRESRANYMLHMVAYDRDLPSRSSSLDVSVRVLDENYNSPLFEPKVYSASVSENATIGLSVLQVSASDVDEGLNGRVRYTIVGGDVNFDFYIGDDCEAKATTRAATAADGLCGDGNVTLTSKYRTLRMRWRRSGSRTENVQRPRFHESLPNDRHPRGG